MVRLPRLGPLVPGLGAGAATVMESESSVRSGRGIAPRHEGKRGEDDGNKSVHAQNDYRNGRNCP